MFVPITITAHNLRKATPLDAKNCLIARAVRPLVRKGVVVEVGVAEIFFTDLQAHKKSAKEVDQPKAVVEILDMFDDSKLRAKIKPGTQVRVNIPKRFLKPSVTAAGK